MSYILCETERMRKTKFIIRHNPIGGRMNHLIDLQIDSFVRPFSKFKKCIFLLKAHKSSKREKKNE